MKFKLNCPNNACSSIVGLKVHIVKHGRLYLKEERRYIQRYKCLICNKTFTSSRLMNNRNAQTKKIKALDDIQKLYCSGMTMRGVARQLKLNPNTVMAKLKTLADSSYQKYFSGDFTYKEQHHPENDFGQINMKTPIIVFDEMETHEHTIMKPISIGIVYDYTNKKIVDIQVAEMRPRGRFSARQRASLPQYSGRRDLRHPMNVRCLKNLKNYLDTSRYAPDIITDGKKNYPNAIKEAFPLLDFNHYVILSNGSPTVDTTETGITDDSGLLQDPHEIRNAEYLKQLLQLKMIKYSHLQAMGSFNRLCATMRGNISRLRRSTYIHTKDIEHLQQVMYVYMDYWNKNH